jgi:hypothetical protein
MKKAEEPKQEEKVFALNDQQVNAVKILAQVANLAQAKGVLSIDDAFVVKQTLDALKEIISDEKGN